MNDEILDLSILSELRLVTGDATLTRSDVLQWSASAVFPSRDQIAVHLPRHDVLAVVALDRLAAIPGVRVTLCPNNGFVKSADVKDGLLTGWFLRALERKGGRHLFEKICMACFALLVAYCLVAGILYTFRADAADPFDARPPIVPTEVTK